MACSIYLASPIPMHRSPSWAPGMQYKMECFIKCTSPVTFKLDFFSCSSPVSRWPQKTCIQKKKFKVRELPCCSWLFKISLRVPASYLDEDWCHIAFQNTPLKGTNRKGKFIKMVTFLFVDSECWITETEGGEKIICHGLLYSWPLQPRN